MVNTPSERRRALSVAKDLASVTGRFVQTLLKRLPDVTDGNPVKAALGIAKLIIEISEVSQLPLHWTSVDYALRE